VWVLFYYIASHFENSAPTKKKYSAQFFEKSVKSEVNAISLTWHSVGHFSGPQSHDAKSRMKIVENLIQEICSLKGSRSLELMMQLLEGQP
jgi:hypothetical protein